VVPLTDNSVRVADAPLSQLQALRLGPDPDAAVFELLLADAG